MNGAEGDGNIEGKAAMDSGEQAGVRASFKLVTGVCEKCGWEIPADAPEGGCPGCLLESGLRLLEEEGQTSNAQCPTSNVHLRAHERAAKYALLSGEFGNYELLEEVGRGGQGVVFRMKISIRL